MLRIGIVTFFVSLGVLFIASLLVGTPIVPKETIWCDIGFETCLSDATRLLDSPSLDIIETIVFLAAWISFAAIVSIVFAFVMSRATHKKIYIPRLNKLKDYMLLSAAISIPILSLAVYSISMVETQLCLSDPLSSIKSIPCETAGTIGTYILSGTAGFWIFIVLIVSVATLLVSSLLMLKRVVSRKIQSRTN